MQRGVNDWIHRHGVMENLISDAGTPFTSDDSKQFFQKKGKLKHTTSSYHPQNDGKAEANIKIIKNIIKRNIFTNITSEKTCKQLVLVHTNSKTAINRSPAELLFGFKLHTPVNSLNNTPELEELAAIRERIYEETQIQMEKYIKKYSEHYNENRKAVEITEDDWVLVRKPHLLKSLESKFRGLLSIAFELIRWQQSSPNPDQSQS